LNVPVPLYGGVPPVAVTVTAVFPLVQLYAPMVTDMLICDGWVMVREIVALHPRASVTVN
jgi:hypothetical protein